MRSALRVYIKVDNDNDDDKVVQYLANLTNDCRLTGSKVKHALLQSREAPSLLSWLYISSSLLGHSKIFWFKESKNDTITQ